LNTALFQAAKAVLEHATAFAPHDPLAALWSLGYAYLDTAAAVRCVRQAVEQNQYAFPLHGMVLQHCYQLAKDKKAVKTDIQILYTDIVAWHRQLYKNYDLAEEGLPCVPHPSECLQDPFFLATLVWSNESLIQLGHFMQKEVLEIIQWNEWTIHSMNEKHWDAGHCRYLAFDVNLNETIQTDFFKSVAPLVGEVPTQDRAELLLTQIQGAFNKSEPLTVVEQWLLRRGLLRYDFVQLAAEIRQNLLRSIKKHGFHKQFDWKTGEPSGMIQEPSPLTAVVTMDLLKRK
jgi:hypothetical protein